MQLESGEYFLSDNKKFEKQWREKQEKQAEKTAQNKRKREAAFIPPEVRVKTVLTQSFKIRPFNFLSMTLVRFVYGLVDCGFASTGTS